MTRSYPKRRPFFFATAVMGAILAACGSGAVPTSSAVPAVAGQSVAAGSPTQVARRSPHCAAPQEFKTTLSLGMNPIYYAGQTSLTMTISTPTCGASSYGSTTFAITLPAGISIVPGSRVTTTASCGSPSTYAGGQYVYMIGAFVPVSSDCSETVQVTSMTGGTITIPRNSVLSPQTITLGSSAAAPITLNVYSRFVNPAGVR